MSFRIATYNIHRCIGRDNIENPERIAAVLRELNSDVVALQEVAHRPHSPGDVLAFLADAIDAAPIEGTTLRDQRGHYGNALLSRIPASTVRRADISVPKRERRGVLDARLAMGNRLIQVVATHLGLRSRERRYQVRRILSILDPNAADITILLGDFNEWFFWSRRLRPLSKVFETLPAPATYPSHRPLLALDRLWVRPRHCLVTLGAHRSRLARMASDHLPLVADIDCH